MSWQEIVLVVFVGPCVTGVTVGVVMSWRDRRIRRRHCKVWGHSWVEWRRDHEGIEHDEGLYNVFRIGVVQMCRSCEATRKVPDLKAVRKDGQDVPLSPEVKALLRPNDPL